jgi:hypothetical protein
MKAQIGKVKSLSDYIESGIEEVARDEGINMEASVYIKPVKQSVPEFTMVFLTFSAWAVQNLKPTTCKLLLLIMYTTHMKTNKFAMDIDSIKEKLQMSKRSVQNALEELKTHNIIISIPNETDRRRNDYIVNPNAMYRGSGFDRDKRIQHLKEQDRIEGRYRQLEFDHMSRPQLAEKG